MANREWVAGEEMFLVCYADNLTDFDLGLLVDAQRAGGAMATLAVFRTDQPSACGIVELDGAGTVIGFVEKPAHPVSNLANAGMYAFHPSVIDEIEGGPPRDIGYHLLPQLGGPGRGSAVEGYMRDIGTIDAYHKAQDEWRAAGGPMIITQTPLAHRPGRRGYGPARLLPRTRRPGAQRGHRQVHLRDRQAALR